MSLHADISNEAKAALAAQQRVSTISSIVISILAVLLIGLLMWIISLAVIVKNPPELISFTPPSIEDNETKKPKTQNNVPRKPTAPTPNIANVISSNSFDSTAIPEPDLVVTEIVMDVSDAEFDDEWSDEAAEDAGAWGELPKSMKKRCSKEDRLERLLKSGGTKECEESVVRSLDFFMRTQDDNGGWHSDTSYPVAYTGMALLSFLGHCETPTSPTYGIAVENAIAYLINVAMKNQGKLASDLKNKHWPYEHAICTYAISEAYTLCSKQGLEIPNLEEAVRMSASFIVDNQDIKKGGWGYSYIQSGQDGSHVDTSVACWQIQAIKAAKYTGIDGIKGIDASAAKALKYLETAQATNGGVYYTNPNTNKPATMTGGGVLCWQQWGKGTRAPAKKGVTYIHNNIKFDYDTADSDLYAHYYYGQAMINVGGKYWQKYNGMFRDSLLAAQLDDGSYKQPGGGGPINGTATTFAGKSPHATHYRTALATLMLEVYYRFLPGSATN